MNVAELYSRHQRHTAKSNSLSGRKQSQQVQHMKEFHSGMDYNIYNICDRAGYIAMFKIRFKIRNNVELLKM